MEYNPLDLSSLSGAGSNQGPNLQATAKAILNHARWNQPSQVTLNEIAKANADAKAASHHKPSFLSGLFDLLQTPLFGVTNALDEAIAGHQSDSSDGILEDIGKTVGGVFTGGAKGLGAGLRGSTTMLDALPGVNINDDWQTDPTDKTHFSDVNLRLATGMSSKDAAKPENWSKALIKARKEKGEIPDAIGDVLYGNMEHGDDQQDIESLYKHLGLTGLAEDVAGDPLNYITFGGKAALTAPSNIEKGIDIARGFGGINDAVKTGLDIKNASGLVEKGAINAGHAPPIGAIDDAVKAGTEIPIKSIGAGIKGFDGFKSISSLGNKAVPKEGFEVALRDQKKLVSEIVSAAATGQKGWIYKAADFLRAHPGVTWTETEKFLQAANRAVKGKHNPAKMAPVLVQKIAHDVSNARKPAGVIERLMNKPGDIVIKPGATKLKRSEAQLANKVVRKFEAEILHTKSAPGTGEGLVRAIASGRNVRYSAPQQARMWNHITANLKYADTAKFSKAVRILRGVENYFISKGAVPHSAWKTAESVPLRLSQVAEAIGPEFLGKTHAFITQILRGDPKALAQLSDKQIQAIEALKHSEATVAAPAVNAGIEAGKGAIEAVMKMPLSIGRRKSLLNQAVDIGKIKSATLGGGDTGAKVAGDYLGNLIGKADPVNSALRANKLKTEAWLANGALKGAKNIADDVAFKKAVTTAISKAAQLPTPAKLAGLSGAKALVANWLGARFNAAYGVQDMHEIYLIQQAGAQATSARRAKLINNLGHDFDPRDLDLWHEAFRAAQQNGITSGKVAELQSEIAKLMENLFGGSGLRSGAIADSTVIGRSRLLVDELNKNLKRFGLGGHQFSNGKKVEDAFGDFHDLSKGMDWMKSWEHWKIDKPYEFLHKVQSAIEHTVREKNMFDEIAARFGSVAKHGAVKYGVDHPRLVGHFFTEEGARQANQFIHALEQISTPNSKSLQYLDHVMSKIKASLTIYVPGHHWTNLIGDVYYNWIAGVNKPGRYEQAMKTMMAQKGRYGDFASFDKLTGPDALKQAVGRSLVKPDAGLEISAKGNQTVVTMKNGTRVTADMIYTAAMAKGILPSAKVLEDVVSDATSVLDKIGLPGKAHGTVQRGIHHISEIRDHIPRLAQFIDGIAKHGGSFKQATEVSSRAVRKWHPDGLDLTQFERQVMKRVFPFYSWTRKALPLAIESAVFNAPKVMAYPRLMEAIGMINGVNPEQGVTDAFPADQLFPDWLRSRGIGPIAGGAGNYLSVNPSTPVLDMFTLMGQPGQSSMDMLNPLAKIPIETAQGQTLGQKVPITNYPDYLSKQIPAVSQLGRASGQYAVSDSTKQEGFPNWINILNMLTGAKATNTGKYQKSAQFDLKDYLKQKGDQQGR